VLTGSAASTAEREIALAVGNSIGVATVENDIASADKPLNQSFIL